MTPFRSSCGLPKIMKKPFMKCYKLRKSVVNQSHKNGKYRSSLLEGTLFRAPAQQKISWRSRECRSTTNHPGNKNLALCTISLVTVGADDAALERVDRKSTRLNSSH